MRIGVLGDTHGHTHRTLDALRPLETFQVEAILHTGDIGSDEIPRLLPPPAHFVLGNVDLAFAKELSTAIRAAGHTNHRLLADLTIAGRRIAVTHGHEADLLSNAIESGDYDLVCYGHTHRVDQRTVGQTLVLNPGALYRATVPSCAVVDLATMTAEILRLG